MPSKDDVNSVSDTTITSSRTDHIGEIDPSCLLSVGRDHARGGKLRKGHTIDGWSREYSGSRFDLLESQWVAGSILVWTNFSERRIKLAELSQPNLPKLSTAITPIPSYAIPFWSVKS